MDVSFSTAFGVFEEQGEGEDVAARERQTQNHFNTPHILLY